MRKLYKDEDDASLMSLLAGYVLQEGCRVVKVLGAGYVRNPHGTPSGSGYRYIHVAGKQRPFHRVVFALHHKRWPTGEIDHKDDNKDHNHYDNLRECTRGANLHNKAKPPGKHSSNYKGVYFENHTQRWRSGVIHEGTRYRSKCFDTEQEALDWHTAKAKELYGDMAREQI